MPVALTTDRPFEDTGIRRRVLVNYAGPAVYIPGLGDVITASQCKLGTIENLVGPAALNLAFTTAYHLIWRPNANFTGGSIIWWDCGTGNEAIGGANLSGYTCILEVSGK